MLIFLREVLLFNQLMNGIAKLTFAPFRGISRLGVTFISTRLGAFRFEEK